MADQNEKLLSVPASLKKLPLSCYAPHPVTGAPVLIMRGMDGHTQVDTRMRWMDLNERKGITPQQVEAMVIGSMFGWGEPGADPDHYTEIDARWLLDWPVLTDLQLA